MGDQIIRVRSEPGIKRDGTKLEGNFYVDGQWVRFQRGLPRKIGGYKQITNYASGIVNQLHMQPLNNFTYTHMGYPTGINRMTIDSLGNTSAPVSRTPAGFTGGANFQWQFDAVYSGIGAGTVVIAHASQSANDISTGIDYPAYLGDIYGTAALTQVPTAPSVCGGIVVFHPYLFLFSKNGYVAWSDANDPTNFISGDAGDAFIATSKIVKGLPLRGGSQNPSGLLWSLDSLIRCYYTGGADVFAFDTISSSSSIIAANSVIEYDGIYFWIGDGRFMMYNGVVREVPNNMNINYFFDGLNKAYANKIFAYKVPRFGEIWWCYPRGTATECTHAVIFNFRENTWYDTELPNGGRSAGLYSTNLGSPILAGVQPVDATVSPLKYKIWRHEVGSDEIDGSNASPISSFFETGDISFTTADTPKNSSMSIKIVEPDFVQSGDMTLQITGRINARAPEVYGPIMTFPEVAQEPYEQVVFFKEQRRELRFKFSSNVIGGDYQMGQVLAHIDFGDGRYQS